MAWDIVGFVVIFIFAVETKQVSRNTAALLLMFMANNPQLALEEMADVFESPNPKQRSFELARIARERAREQRNSARV
jgi:hypothetical protein